ncbi:MAG: fucose-binding protein [Nitriliruptor sp.]|nr:MAG: fucose-binding protein [Nitriliruptor sp.]
MLRGIDPLITPDLLGTLARLGHGDRIAVVDRNFPAYQTVGTVHEITGADTVEVLRAVCSLVPIDSFQDPAVWQMVSDGAAEPGPAGAEVESVLAEVPEGPFRLGRLERTDFYEQARGAAAAVRTADDRPYACFLLATGVL